MWLWLWCCVCVLCVWQIEKEKFKLFFILMHVPSTVVKHLTRGAQAGYDRMRLQLNSENADMDSGENDQNLDDCQEVRLRYRQVH